MTKTTREKTTYKQISGYNDWTTKPEMKTPKQHEQREQALRKSIESILFANGVKCDEEQFLIEDIEHLLSKERETQGVIHSKRK